MEEVELIKMYFKRCINDRFVFWSFHFSFEQFIICLNNLHSSVKFASEKAETMVNERGKFSLTCESFLTSKLRSMITSVYYKTFTYQK